MHKALYSIMNKPENSLDRRQNIIRSIACTVDAQWNAVWSSVWVRNFLTSVPQYSVGNLLTDFMRSVRWEMHWHDRCEIPGLKK